jgi:serine protease inhibitor
MYEKQFQSARDTNGSESYELRSANKLFVEKRLKLNHCIADVFGDEVEPLDFVANPEAARQNINKWVEIQTKRHIQELIPRDKITTNTELVLVRRKHANFNYVRSASPANSKVEFCVEKCTTNKLEQSCNPPEPN